MTIKVVTNQKIAETSSKGNQEKWFDDKTNRWYKLDLFGYEALAETIISTLLQKSNIQQTGFNIVSYQMEKIEVRKSLRTGCSSKNFLQNEEEIITLAHLLKNIIGSDYLTKIEKQKKLQGKIDYIVKQTEDYTGLDRFGEYLTLLFEVDMLFLNDDRHLNNIAIIRNEDKFDYCPLFDFGAGLLSNIREYPLDIEPLSLIKNIVAKPFNYTFNRQVHAAQDLFGKQLECNFLKEDINLIFEKAKEYYPNIYIVDFYDRIYTCIKTQYKKLYT